MKLTAWAVPAGRAKRSRRIERPARARLVAGPARLMIRAELRGCCVRPGLIGTGLA